MVRYSLGGDEMPGLEDSGLPRPGSPVLGEKHKLCRSPHGANCVPQGLLAAGIRASSTSVTDQLAAVASKIKLELGCDAVGIRLVDEDGNATYRVHDGFPDAFFSQSRPVSLFRDRCICAQILSGDIDPDSPLFTEKGSLVIGSAAECRDIIGGVTADIPHLLGDECEFQSVILCRIRCMEHNLGLIHCADSQPHRFSSQSVRMLEEFAERIGHSLFYDSLWMPAAWTSGTESSSTRAVCPICRRLRDDGGNWIEERRIHPRISWSVLRVPQLVCPHCLQFCNAE